MTLGSVGHSEVPEKKISLNLSVTPLIVTSATCSNLCRRCLINPFFRLQNKSKKSCETLRYRNSSKVNAQVIEGIMKKSKWKSDIQAAKQIAVGLFRKQFSCVVFHWACQDFTPEILGYPALGFWVVCLPLSILIESHPGQGFVSFLHFTSFNSYVFSLSICLLLDSRSEQSNPMKKKLF